MSTKVQKHQNKNFNSVEKHQNNKYNVICMILEIKKLEGKQER